MTLAKVHVLLICPQERAEFQRPLADLRSAAEVYQCPSPAIAAQYLRQAASPPVVIVIAQSRPGEFLHAELETLNQLAPLARFVLLLGSWCEGETRTGHVWPVAKRVYWYDWAGEATRNLLALSAGRWAPWLAPVTSLEEERFLPAQIKTHTQRIATLDRPADSSNSGKPLVLVCTPRSSFADALCTALRQRGYAALWQRPDRLHGATQVSAILWEGIQLLPAEVAEVQQLASRWPHTPILALADFPRWETHERAMAAGASAVLAKPCLLEDVFGLLERWCPLQAVSTAEHAA